MGVGLHLIAIEGKGLVDLPEEVHLPLVGRRHLNGLLGEIFCHGILEQPVVAFASDDLFAPVGATEKKVEQQPYQREKHQHQYPRQGLHRVTTVKHYHDYRTDYQPEVHQVKGY